MFLDRLFHPEAVRTEYEEQAVKLLDELQGYPRAITAEEHQLLDRIKSSPHPDILQRMHVIKELTEDEQ